MIGNLVEITKLLLNFGAAGLIVWFMWRLTDKWAGLFLGAQKDQTSAMTHQADAMTSLAASVQAGQGDQHEILLAVRVQSRQIEDMKKILVEGLCQIECPLKKGEKG